MGILHIKTRCFGIVFIWFLVFTGSISAQVGYESDNIGSNNQIFSINFDIRESYYGADSNYAGPVNDSCRGNAGIPAGSWQGKSAIGRERIASGSILRVPAEFSTIQSAIDAAQTGNTIIVSTGNYIENIDFKGKRINLTGSGSKTIINGGFKGPVVTFKSGEGKFSVLDGFVIKNGQNSRGGGIAVLNGSSPQIINNIIFSNDADTGSAILCSGPGTSPFIVNNTIASNFNSTGAITCIHSSHPSIINTIIWHNRGTSIFLEDTSKVSVSFSDIEGGTFIGVGNISSDPLFTNPGLADFRLHSGSPCIDTGTGAGAPADDINKNIRPRGKGTDMGAFEYGGSNNFVIGSNGNNNKGGSAHGGCFIATAAYGTPLAREVRILSRFRDEYLLSNSLGRKLVSFYYRISPPMADYIKDKPFLRLVIRCLLWPVVFLLDVLL